MASAKGFGRSSGPSGPMSLDDMESMMSDQDRERESRQSFDPDRIGQDDIMGLTEGYSSAPTPGDLGSRDPVTGLTKSEREDMARDFYSDTFGPNNSLQGPIGNLGVEAGYYSGAPDVGIGPPANAGIQSSPFSGVANEPFGFAPGLGTQGPLDSLDAYGLGAAEEAREAARSRDQQRNAAQYGYNASVDRAIADTTRNLGQPAIGQFAQPAIASPNPFGEAFASDPFGAPSYSRVASFAQRDLDPNFSMAANPVSNVANALATPEPANRFAFASPALSQMANNMAPPSPVANPNRSRVAAALAAPAARAPAVASYSSRAPSHRSYSGVQPAVANQYSYSLAPNPFGENFSVDPFSGSVAAGGFGDGSRSGTGGSGIGDGGYGGHDDPGDSGDRGGGGIGGGIGGVGPGGTW
jgi:hypothetical protein